MITRASKIFFALAAAAWSLGVAYAVVTTGLNNGGVMNVLGGDGAVNALLGPLTFGYKGSVGDHVGFAILMGFAVCCLFAGGVTSAFRDGNAEALAEVMQLDAVPAVAAPADLSPWPIVGALGAGVATLGLASSSTMFIIGTTIMAVAALEWTVKAWSEQATGDTEVNQAIRNRLMYPVELPIGALTVVVLLGVSASQLLLSLSKTASWIVLSIGAIAILVTAVVLASMPKLRRSVAIGAIVVGAAAFLVVGVIGALVGPREFKKHSEGHSEEGSAVFVPNSSTDVNLGEYS